MQFGGVARAGSKRAFVRRAVIPGATGWVGQPLRVIVSCGVSSSSCSAPFALPLVLRRDIFG
eukprot:10929365-Lingulodinium_polyedra.AAC.1